MEIWRGDCYYLKSLSSAAFQVELAKTQAEPSEAITDFLGEGSGLDLVNEVLEEEINKLDDDVVEQDKYNVGVDLNGINEVAEEDFQNLTDGEFEEDTRAHEEVTDFVEEGKILDEAKGQDRVTGDILKKQGAHKRLFKLSVSTGGSTKMRLVQAGRKGTLAKSGIRQGDGTKQTEDKGTSNPKPGPAKTSIDFMDHIITVTTLWEQWLASADTAFGLIKPSAVPDRMVRYKVHNRIREIIRFPLDTRSWVPFETGGSLEKMSIVTIISMLIEDGGALFCLVQI
ncbi:hypothetical protein HID58_042326 [Brassica napus]|uniref:Uncharacterized protein n=1 Tax=Brassica napus TaxID=3708 RepID=A0ABQ8BDN6_BRANA|nr:hypothetical protein HID58_042326 [Brassica napus]